MESLKPLVAADGVILDTFVEDTFCWSLEQSQSLGTVPYRRDWVGFIHNPPGIPDWHEPLSAPQHIISLPAWRESMAACRGLFTFSLTMRDWLAARVDTPVEALIHPTESPARVFRLDRFLSLKRPRIVQIGAWLRRVNSIARLEVSRLQKTCLIPRPDGAAYLDSLVRREQANDPSACGADWSSVDLIQHLDPEAFDDLLTRSVVFLDLYDTVVNNTVIECIVRGTPLVCNRLPALVELLGADYPLFFSTLEEAAAKVEDFSLVRAAAEHLESLSKVPFTGAYFARSLADSAIYRNLPLSRSAQAGRR
jgi:hypothetical protein